MKMRFGFILLVVIVLSGDRPASVNSLHILFPSSIPSVKEEVELAKFVHPFALEKLQSAKFTFLPPVLSEGTLKGYTETSTRCWIVVDVFDAYLVALAGNYPETVSALLSGPYSLWQVTGISDSSYQVTFQINERGERETTLDSFREKAKVGEVTLWSHRLSPATETIGLACACRFLHGIEWITQDMPRILYPDQAVSLGGLVPSSLEEALRYLYWRSIAWQVKDAVILHYIRKTRLPANRVELSEVVGPENSIAWNPVVEKYVEEILPRLKLPNR